MTVTIKEKLQIDLADFEDLEEEDDENQDGPEDDEEPEIVESVMEICVFKDEENADLNIVHFRNVKGDFTVNHEADIRATKSIQDIIHQDE